MELELIGGVVAVPVIIGLVQVTKKVLRLEDEKEKVWAPVAAIVIGLAASFGYQFFKDTAAYVAAVRGLALGLSAVGLYSGRKNVTEGMGGE